MDPRRQVPIELTEAVQLNLDDLCERRRRRDILQVNAFNLLLKRVHARIKCASRQIRDNEHCWFDVPLTMMGCPQYDQATAIAYLVDQLRTNGFRVQLFEPFRLLIAWNHWVPTYVRDEVQRRTGIELDEYGRRIVEEEDPVESEVSTDPSAAAATPKREYLSTKTYRPSGQLYSKQSIRQLEERFA